MLRRKIQFKIPGPFLAGWNRVSSVVYCVCVRSLEVPILELCSYSAFT